MMNMDGEVRDSGVAVLELRVGRFVRTTLTRDCLTSREVRK